MNCKNSKNNTSTSIIKNVQQQNSALSVNGAVNNMNECCSCGCGFELGSSEFIRLHVESQEEQEQREALEQYNAEQEASKQMHEEQMQTQHPQICGCVECI